ncbi:MBL fold metallo-hydrolase [Chryseobacterium sp. POL2]|uniref:MBL fold metallo-hydrolase n=1 Tax=Chryseobacterium sp. POL2 TaxID=2713414 RepID=UPI0013E18AE4|nr:MBL fold metallo-hydrolase [Chryseobacterium sp. POL2]QIG90825.1 MBL fold metallo-hydrolase [Chryseobacterium sp. POL2]
MTFIFVVIFAIAISIFLFIQQPTFGAKAKGIRLERMKKSSNFKNGKFHNLEHTPNLGQGYSMPKVMWDFLTTKTPEKFPIKDIPSQKTDLKTQDPNNDFFVWMGHSSYFFQIDKTKFLVDPVLSGSASPINGTTKAFRGTDIYDENDFPDIDYLIITHDHYDHLDYKSMKNLKSKINKIVCPLGVGAHLEHWGFEDYQIIELDWYEDSDLKNDLKITSTPARHFSGRGFHRNTSLWSSYVLKTKKHNLFLGGDSGYGQHFKTIKEKYGPFDWAILENGQYNVRWQYIHTLPEETLQVIEDLGATKVIPVHSCKFALAMHSWHEPLDKISENSAGKNFKIFTPMIGEKLDFNNDNQSFSNWWKS